MCRAMLTMTRMHTLSLRNPHVHTHAHTGEVHMLARAADTLSLKLAGAEAKQEGLVLAAQEARDRKEEAEVSTGSFHISVLVIIVSRKENQTCALLSLVIWVCLRPALPAAVPTFSCELAQSSGLAKALTQLWGIARECSGAVKAQV
eukprot:1159813-Pelagomonas_calceolata.AAC.5